MDDKIGIIVKITKNKTKGEIITNIGICSLKEPSGANLRLPTSGLFFSFKNTFSSPFTDIL
jgi:hypothetical protein